MAEYVEVVETYWSTCWKWGFIPYPCRKSRRVMRWHYHFSYLIVSYRGVRSSYDGCENNLRYRWSKWELTGEFRDFILYEHDMYFSSKKSDTGACIGVPGTGGVIT